jgi:3-hexulose-6-phosphate synthase
MNNEISYQLSLDLTKLEDALSMARLGVESGVNVLEAGTILIMSEGAARVLPALRQEFPGYPLVADVKCTDGVAYEMALVFDLGATSATVMASASDASIKYAVREAALRPGCNVMVDTMGCGGPEGLIISGQVEAAKRARDLGAQYVVLHLGFDERSENRRMVDDDRLLRWAEAVAKEDLGIRIQVVGGLTLAQAKALPQLGIQDIVISMNLGNALAAEMHYSKATGFTVNLDDPVDRERVSNQIRRFVESR